MRRILVEAYRKDGEPGEVVKIDGGILNTFKMRLSHLIDRHHEEQLDKPPIRNMDPEGEKGRIVIVPAGDFSTRCLIKMINEGVQVNDLKFRAACNQDLPEMTQISVKYESERDPKILFEHPTRGIARVNGWDVPGRQIIFQGLTPHAKTPSIKFARLNVSKKVVDYIRSQQGLLWITGGQASAWWRGRDLTMEVEVDYELQ